MATIDSFIKNLSPVKAYRLSEKSNLYYELQTYAQEFDRLRIQLDKLLRECFLFTAEDYGLSNFELIYTAAYNEETPQVRRDRIFQRLSIDDGCVTLSDVKKAIKSFGAENFNIIEFYGRYNIVVEVYGEYSQSEIDFIRTEIKKIMPAHQKAEVYFGGLSWSEIDSRNLAFSEMDAKNYSWNTIDELKNN